MDFYLPILGSDFLQFTTELNSLRQISFRDFGICTCQFRDPDFKLQYRTTILNIFIICN